jgi:hypothetical protein
MLQTRITGIEEQQQEQGQNKKKGARISQFGVLSLCIVKFVSTVAFLFWSHIVSALRHEIV